MVTGKEENTEIFCSKFCSKILERCQQDPSSQYFGPLPLLRDLPSKISSPQIQLGALEKPNGFGDLWSVHLEKPSTWCDFLWFSLSSWETMGNWDQHRFVVSNIEVLLKYYWSHVHPWVDGQWQSYLLSGLDGNLGGGRDMQRDPGWGRALWFSRQDLVTRYYSLMSSWCVRAVFIFVCLHPLQDFCFVTLHAAHTAHAAHAMNIKKTQNTTCILYNTFNMICFDMFWLWSEYVFWTTCKQRIKKSNTFPVTWSFFVSTGSWSEIQCGRSSQPFGTGDGEAAAFQGIS